MLLSTSVPVPQLQPYQGRNPCMERNLMLQSDSCEELGCQGNVLVNRSSKHSGNDAGAYGKHSSSETQSLVPHDYLGQQQQHHHQHQQLHHVTSSQQLSLRPVTPIPYVQVGYLLLLILLTCTFHSIYCIPLIN